MGKQLKMLCFRYELNPNEPLVARAIEHVASGGDISIKGTYIRDLLFMGGGVLAVNARCAESLLAHVKPIVEKRIGYIDWRPNEVIAEDFYT